MQRIPRLLPHQVARSLVFTRSTPPQEEGCRPASRGFVLELVTFFKSHWEAKRCQSVSQAISHNEQGVSYLPGLWTIMGNDHPEQLSDVAR